MMHPQKVFTLSGLLVLAIWSSALFEQEKLPSRNLADLPWQMVKEWVPGKINTILLPVGTIEAHGAICNGADCVVPEEMAKRMAEPLNALIAPVVSYGVTGSLTRYPGSIRIESEIFRAYVQQIVEELARNQFKNIIILNGHGGNRQALDQVAEKVSLATAARVFVLDWWSYTSDITLEVFKEDGGHAGKNETAAVQAVNPKLVYPNYYKKSLARENETAYTARPHPWPIMLYKKGEGYPDFDAKTATVYLDKVVAKCLKLIQDVIRAWDEQGL